MAGDVKLEKDEKESLEKEEKREETEQKVQKCLKGYAVVCAVAKAKVEDIQKSLCKNKTLVQNLAESQEDIGDVPEEMLSVTTVSASLIAEDDANEALEDYLHSRFFSDIDQKEISDPATLALTEIFHSCFIMEQRHESCEFRQESGYISLGKDHILQNAQENLLCTFLNNIRPPKKSLAEQTMHVLRRYGQAKSPTKET